MAQTQVVSLQRIGELQRLLQEQTVELVEIRKALENLTYSASHDLRAPVRHINGYAQLVLEEYGDSLDPQCRQYLEKIQDSARRLGNMLGDMHALARVSQQELRRRRVDLNALVREVKQELASEAMGRSVTWKIADLPALECDPEMMKQVFSHLIANALKFTRNQPTARVEIGSLQQDGTLTFFVRDNGVGFDMKFADRLFGLFQRLHPQQDFEGRGAGLALVQRILQRHGGRVWAEAEPEKGATFYFSLERRPLPPDSPS